MINISTSSKLDIILPNTNKALAHVLQNSTLKELESITKGKDLKSVMNSILKESGSNPQADKELLQLVKSNPTLKSLGDVSTTIKDLLSSIKDDKNPLPVEKVLKGFLVDIKDLKNSELKQKLENSGLFLESKLKDVKNPQVELKSQLTALLKTLETTTTASTKNIRKEAFELLKSEPLKSALNVNLTQDTKNNLKSLNLLASKVEALVSKIESAIKGGDAINNPQLSKTLQKLEQQISPKFLTPENFKLDSLKESLNQISLIANKSLAAESKSILDSLQKIFQALKVVEQTASTPKASLEQLLNKNISKEIKLMTQDIQAVMQKSDPIFSKEVVNIVQKLQTLAAPEKLHIQANVKEILTNDLKAVLLQAGEEITKSSHPNQNELLKNIDKLSLQIDNYQLLSHLSNGSLLYLPFSWDMLQEGHIEFQKTKDDKFYCDINLKLQEYGELNLKLTLYEENQLNLHIYSSSEEFKELVKENLSSLRSSLIDSGVTPREIRIFEPKQTSWALPYQSCDDNLQMGFEVKA